MLAGRCLTEKAGKKKEGQKTCRMNGMLACYTCARQEQVEGQRNHHGPVCLAKVGRTQVDLFAMTSLAAILIDCRVPKKPRGMGPWG